MYTDDGSYFVRLCVDHADVVGIGVGDVNLIFARVRRQPGWTLPYRYNRLDGKSTQVNDCNRIASAVADISVLTIIRYRIRRTPASAQGSSEQAENNKPALGSSIAQLLSGLYHHRLTLWFLHIAVHHRGNLANFRHQLIKLVREERLHPI